MQLKDQNKELKKYIYESYGLLIDVAESLIKTNAMTKES